MAITMGFYPSLNNHKKLLSDMAIKKSDSKYFMRSRCHQSKHKTNKGIIDILDCNLTITEKVASSGTEPVHIIATLRFFINKNDKYLIKNSLTCY